MVGQRSRAHILVVDDALQMRLALRQGLEADGYTVSEAGSKAELLERLDGQPTIDLITLDLSLADGDGFGLAREVRARHNIPFIMITGRAEPVDRATGLEHGADDYIVKPFHIREALIRIDTVLRRYGKREVSAETGARPNDTCAMPECSTCSAGRSRPRTASRSR